MRAGKLDKTIAVQRRGETVDDYGTVSEGWTDLVTIRAQVIQSSTEEFLQASGTTGQAAIIFRIRWREGFEVADRVVYAGKNYDLKEIKELGRREGMDLRCLAGE
jgi:SPP1 family predicted phage head-tail adaptor